MFQNKLMSFPQGVTFCGTSKGNSLTMQNVPWHSEVLQFSEEVVKRIRDQGYHIACEHEHSNCVLIAHERFRVDGVWHTWIDYPKFQKLYGEYMESGGKKKFTAEDYHAATPTWALYGSVERGFNPGMTRFKRNAKSKKDVGGC